MCLLIKTMSKIVIEGDRLSTRGQLNLLLAHEWNEQIVNEGDSPLDLGLGVGMGGPTHASRQATRTAAGSDMRGVRPAASAAHGSRLHLMATRY